MSILKSIGSGIETVSGFVKPGLDFLNKNKDAINAIGGLASSYFDYKTNRDIRDLARSEIAENRRITARAEDREELQESNMATGFSRGFLDREKKRNPFLFNTQTPSNTGYGTLPPASLAAQ